jgi:hypothetical protein
MASDTLLHGKIATVQEAKAHHVARLGGRCVCCGEMAVEFLEVTWASDNRRNLGGFDAPGAFYAYLDIQPDDRAEPFVVRCADCHHAIARHGICPHEAGRRQERGEPIDAVTLREIEAVDPASARIIRDSRGCFRRNITSVLPVDNRATKSSPAPAPVFRFLAVIELEGEGDLDDAEYLFLRFQEDAEWTFARAVERATLADLEVFAPEVVKLGEGQIDVEVPPLAALDDDDDDEDDDDDPGDVGNPRYASDGPELTPEEQAQLDDYVDRQKCTDPPRPLAD